MENTPYQASPVHHTVHDGLLLGAGPPQIDPGGLNALMSHKVRQQGQVIEPFQKAFGKPVAEGMGIGTAGSMPYRRAMTFSCPATPLVVIRRPCLFKKRKPLVWFLPSNQASASSCKSFGM